MDSSGSFLLDRTAAEKAVSMSLPMIAAAMQDRQFGENGFLYIVIMDPALTPANSSFEKAVLYEYAVGDREKWDADYALFARLRTCSVFVWQYVQARRDAVPGAAPQRRNAPFRLEPGGQPR